MNIKSYGTANFEQLKEAESILGFELPKDYKEFLLNTNGGTNVGYKLCFFVKELNDEIIIDSLYGVGLDSNIDILAYADMFGYDMFPESIVIGDSIQHGFIVMICNGTDKGIYYWDDSYTYEASNDEGNMYWIAKTFSEFFNLISGENQ